MNLTYRSFEWEPRGKNEYASLRRASGKVHWSATRVDLVFG